MSRLTGVLAASISAFLDTKILVMDLFGAYIGGVSNNSGELNPGKWDWNDKWTYISMGIGGAAGALGGYGIMNPGMVELVAGVSSPYLAAGITSTAGAAALGQGTNWKYDLHWTTAAEGGGYLNLNGNNSATADQLVTEELEGVRQAYGSSWHTSSYGDFKSYRY